MLTLTPEERAQSELIDSLTAQAQRDFELAAEWQATAEQYRGEVEALRTEVAELRAAGAARAEAVAQKVVADAIVRPPIGPARRKAAYSRWMSQPATDCWVDGPGVRSYLRRRAPSAG